jgi:hypothetical protein
VRSSLQAKNSKVPTWGNTFFGCPAPLARARMEADSYLAPEAARACRARGQSSVFPILPTAPDARVRQRFFRQKVLKH